MVTYGNTGKHLLILPKDEQTYFILYNPDDHLGLSKVLDDWAKDSRLSFSKVEGDELSLIAIKITPDISNKVDRIFYTLIEQLTWPRSARDIRFGVCDAAQISIKYGLIVWRISLDNGVLFCL